MRRLLAIPLLCALAGCRDGEPGPVLGTTEWDRIALTAEGWLRLDALVRSAT